MFRKSLTAPKLCIPSIVQYSHQCYCSAVAYSALLKFTKQFDEICDPCQNTVQNTHVGWKKNSLLAELTATLEHYIMHNVITTLG